MEKFLAMTENGKVPRNDEINETNEINEPTK
jgi:hypothetical protein